MNSNPKSFQLSPSFMNHVSSRRFATSMSTQFHGLSSVLVNVSASFLWTSLRDACQVFPSLPRLRQLLQTCSLRVLSQCLCEMILLYMCLPIVFPETRICSPVQEGLSPSLFADLSMHLWVSSTFTLITLSNSNLVHGGISTGLPASCKMR
jgi:hypothetical protein